jgi:integrase
MSSNTTPDEGAMRKPRRDRDNGDGALFQLKDGRWRAEVYFGFIDGKHARRATVRKDKNAAKEWLKATLKEKEQGVLVAKSVTVAAWFDRYLIEVAQPKLRASTYANYRRFFDLHLRPALGTVKLGKLEPQHLARLYQAKLNDGLSPASVRYLHAVIRRGLNMAVRWGLVARNVATLVDPPSLPFHEVAPLNLEEARTLLTAARGDRMEARWVVGLSLGLRQGEVLGLWWEDIDLVAGVLRVRRQLLARRKVNDELTFGPLKGGRSSRVLSLPPSVAEILLDHRDRQDRERAECGQPWGDERLVFTTRDGRPVDHWNDYRAFKNLLVRANVRCEEVATEDGKTKIVPRLRLHDLRHTAASLLLVQGVSPRVVMEVLGHSQISLTMNTYTHVMPSLLDGAATEIETALWEKPKKRRRGKGSGGGKRRAG